MSGRSPCSSGRLARARDPGDRSRQPAQQRGRAHHVAGGVELDDQRVVHRDSLGDGVGAVAVRVVVDQQAVHRLERQHGMDLAQPVASPWHVVACDACAAWRGSRTAGARVRASASHLLGVGRQRACGTMRGTQGTCAVRAGRRCDKRSEQRVERRQRVGQPFLVPVVELEGSLAEQASQASAPGPSRPKPRRGRSAAWPARGRGRGSGAATAADVSRDGAGRAVRQLDDAVVHERRANGQL